MASASAEGGDKEQAKADAAAAAAGKRRRRRNGHPLAPSAAAQPALDYVQRVVDLFLARRRQLHADLYLPSLDACMRAGAAAYARELVALRREGKLVTLRRAQERQLVEAEARVEAWAARAEDEAAAEALVG